MHVEHTEILEYLFYLFRYNRSMIPRQGTRLNIAFGVGDLKCQQLSTGIVQRLQAQ